VLKKLGKYELLGELGHGAMGVVYRARDPIINRLVALKTITTGVADDPALLQRFYREAQSAGGLQHPNIVTIYDMGEAGELPYIAMELVEGENLEQVIARRSTLPLTLKLVYSMQACRAFDYAHKRGIVHRDIKPGNVMLSKEGVVKVVDFGIARVLENSRTQTGLLIGTFAYMSPEQYHGEHADERSDIWSFGVLVYELLCYQKPFTGPTPASLMHNICNLEAKPLNQVLPGCPDDLALVVGKMLRKSPVDRYQSMEDVLLDLDPICKTLQAQSVVDLLEQARQLLGSGNFAEGRELVRQALQLDSGNSEARTLLEKANVELKRISNRPKVQQLVEKGRALLDEGKLQEAKIAVQSALRLDTGFVPAEELQRAIQTEEDRIRLVTEYLEGARQKLAEGLPDDADGLLSKVFEADPSNAQAKNLQELVAREKAEREKARRLLEGLRRARELWTLQNYAECLSALQELERQFPGEDEISRLRETALEDQTEQRKQHMLLKSRNLFAAGHHTEAIELLSDLEKQFPSDREMIGLLEEVRKDQINQLRLLGLAEARNLLAAGQFDSCISLLTSLNESFPEDQEIPRLLEGAQQSRTEQIHQQGLVEAKSLLTSGQYDSCISLLTSLQQSFPEDPKISELLKSADKNKAEQVRQRGITEASKLLAARRYEACANLLSDLEKQFPGDEDIQGLQKTIRNEEAEQEKQQDIEKARNLLGTRRYDECLSLLASLQRRFPADTEIPKLQDAAREDRAKQQRLSILERARNCLASKSYEKAADELASLLKESPEDDEARKLLEFTRKEQGEQRRREGLAKAQELIAARRYEDAIALSTQLYADFAGDTAVVNLLESARKEQAKHIQSVGLAEARRLLADRRYAESIAYLSILEKDFPDEPEIARLLDTAREDLAEQGKQQKLAEARSLLAAQSFEQALIILGSLAAEHPKDTAVSKLDALVRREQDKHVKAQRLEREVDALKRLMGEKKYLQVMTRAKQLLAEFPSDPNLLRLSEFASSRQVDIEKEALFQHKFAEANNLLAAGRFDDTMRLVKAALKTFPSNAELQGLYKQAETQQKKLEVRQKIEQRIREVRVKINRAELSEAVDLAQQTLMTLGPDTDLSQLLNSAQMELLAREKKRSQENTLETIRTMIDSGDLDGATRTMHEVLENQTIDAFDPRIERLGERIQEAKTAAAQPTLLPSSGVPGLSKEYAFLQTTPLPEAPPEKSPSPNSTTNATPSAAGASAPLPWAAPDKPAESQGSFSETVVPSRPDAAALVQKPDRPPVPAPSVEIDVPKGPEGPARLPAARQPAARPQPVARSIWLRTPVLVLSGVIFLVAGWLVVRSQRVPQKTESPPATKTVPQSTTPEVDPLEVEQRKDLEAAGRKIAENDLDGAAQLLRKSATINGPLTTEIQNKLAQVEESQKDANLRQVRQREEELWQRAIKLVADQRYSEAQKDLKQILTLPAGGVRRDDAQRYLDKTIPQAKTQSALLSQAQQSLAQGDFAAARRLAGQFEQNGGNAAQFVANINQAEQSQLKQLEGFFEQAKQLDDDSALQQLKALQPKFQVLAGDGGPQSSEALTYANSVPAAINDMRARLEKKNADAAFEETVRRYRQASASNDRNALSAVRSDFQSIIQNGGAHASRAQEYVGEINNKLEALNAPPPPPTAPKDTVNKTVTSEAAVRSVIQTFFQAFEQRDPDALKQVWPGMPQQRYERYKGSFENVGAISIRILSEAVKISPDGGSATVTVQSEEQETPKGEKKPRTFKPVWTFRLVQNDGTWRLMDVL
jgi:eukaryotic-like serine/threonine-protein kinase